MTTVGRGSPSLGSVGCPISDYFLHYLRRAIGELRAPPRPPWPLQGTGCVVLHGAGGAGAVLALAELAAFVLGAFALALGLDAPRPESLEINPLARSTRLLRFFFPFPTAFPAPLPFPFAFPGGAVFVSTCLFCRGRPVSILARAFFTYTTEQNDRLSIKASCGASNVGGEFAGDFAPRCIRS